MLIEIYVLYVWFSFSLLFFSFRAGCMVDFVSQALSLLLARKKRIWTDWVFTKGN